MMTVREVSELTGVSVRALHHYDSIGLLPPTAVSEAGYRLYDEAALERLQHILLFRELQFPLKDIRAILDGPNFDRNRALRQQIQLLELKKEHLQNLIDLARSMEVVGMPRADFTAFDMQKIDEYAREARESWGETPAWREYQRKSKGRTPAQDRQLGTELMTLLAAFGAMRDQDPAGEAAQAQVERLRAFITANYYTCTDEILASLGRIYGGGGRMTENIDDAGGPGTADFAAKAIAARCGTGE